MPRSYVAKGNKAAAKTPQELMREQRGAPEDQGQAAAAAAANGRGVRLLDPPAYSSMLPEEQAAT